MMLGEKVIRGLYVVCAGLVLAASLAVPDHGMQFVLVLFSFGSLAAGLWPGAKS
jgi:hypothetical protein